MIQSHGAYLILPDIQGLMDRLIACWQKAQLALPVLSSLVTVSPVWWASSEQVQPMYSGKGTKDVEVLHCTVINYLNTVAVKLLATWPWLEKCCFAQDTYNREDNESLLRSPRLHGGYYTLSSKAALASAELALYHGKFWVAMETTLADHLARCCRPLSVYFCLFFPHLLSLKMQRNTEENNQRVLERWLRWRVEADALWVFLLSPWGCNQSRRQMV